MAEAKRAVKGFLELNVSPTAKANMNSKAKI
jgi:hypothetical protein